MKIEISVGESRTIMHVEASADEANEATDVVFDIDMELDDLTELAIAVVQAMQKMTAPAEAQA